MAEITVAEVAWEADGVVGVGHATDAVDSLQGAVFAGSMASRLPPASSFPRNPLGCRLRPR